MSDGDPHRYTDREMAAILKRAAELGEKESQLGSGVSLDELERIGEEAGIDAALVRRAAAELGKKAERPSGWARLTGGPLRLSYVWEVDGEITAAEHEVIAEALLDVVDEPGQPSTVGRTFSWRATRQGRDLMITVAPKDGRTVIRLEERLQQLAGGVWGGVFGGVGGGLVPLLAIGGFALGPLAGALSIPLGLFAAAGGTRAIYKKVVERRREQLESAGQKLRESVTALMATRAEAPAPAAPAPAPAATADSALEAARQRQGVRKVAGWVDEAEEEEPAEVSEQVLAAGVGAATDNDPGRG
jgi:hypothetical protein